jgi:hypothetical protein
MAKVRVHELAKTHDMSAQDVLDKLRAAGIKVKAPASAVDEDAAKAAIEGRPLPTNGKAAAPAKAPEPAKPAPAVRRAPPPPPAASDRAARLASSSSRRAASAAVAAAAGPTTTPSPRSTRPPPRTPISSGSTPARRSRTSPSRWACRSRRSSRSS